MPANVLRKLFIVSSESSALFDAFVAAGVVCLGLLLDVAACDEMFEARLDCCC